MLSLRALCSAVVVTAGTVAGCKPAGDSPDKQASSGGIPDSAGGAPATVNVMAKDFGFDAPAQFAAGLVTIHLENQGKELHQAQIVRLEDGKTVQDLAAAMKKHGPTPSWVKFVGGPNGVAQGQQSNATSVLAPGNYAYLCFIPSPDGVIHAAKGMVQPFEVTASSSAASAALPESDVTVKLVDYDFQLSKPLTPGKHTVLVENGGPQPHEVVLLKLAPGKKVEDFAAWAEGGLKGPPPAEPLGGVTVLDKGGRGSFQVELSTGDYGFICFVPDSKDGKPHLAHGMMKTIRVG
ncbi:MAG TPA: hypothetical protein VKA25_10765 [Gemmatimonadales bacterium]|nr:hypothetical protein [Gemmatimonadales bacterium]